MDASLEPTQNDHELEELSAYLDGELSDEDAVCVERRLATDSDYRKQMQTLNSTWDMLDSLSHQSVDVDCSRRTLTMIATVASDELASRRRFGLVTTVGKLIAFLCGLALFGWCGYTVGWRISAPRTITVRPSPTVTSDEPTKTQRDAFIELLQSLTTVEKQELLNILFSDQPDLLQERVEEEKFRQIANVDISSNDIQGIFQWINTYALRHEKQMLALLPQKIAGELRAIDDQPKRLRQIMISVLYRYDVLPRMDQDDFITLNALISEDARQHILACRHITAQEELLQLWMQAAVLAQTSD